MCSVVGCKSWRRRVQRFNLPEDPEKRLQWVQFVLEANGHRLMEKFWTDITVCSEHFLPDCFEEQMKTGTVQLKPGALPSVCVDSPVPSVCVDSPVPSVCVDSPVTSVCVDSPVSSVCVDSPVSSVCVDSPVPSVCVDSPVPSVCVDSPVPSVCVDSPVSSVCAVQSEPDEHGLKDNVGDGSSLNIQLCTDCEVFFSRGWPHTCVQKTKLSCNVSGIKLVQDTALNGHSRIHGNICEFQCKYCNTVFKTEDDKLRHERMHITAGKLCTCPECLETLTSEKEYNVHLEVHKSPRLPSVLNEQRMKEKSRTDGTLCSKHFLTDCFEKQSDTVQLKHSVPQSVWRESAKQLDNSVPSAYVMYSESEVKQRDSSQYGESLESEKTACQVDNVETCESLPCVTNSKHTLADAVTSEYKKKQETVRNLDSRQSKESEETADVACQCDNMETSESLKKHTLAVVNTSRCKKIQQSIMDTGPKRGSTPLPQMKGKYVVNETCLLELFAFICPSCGYPLKMEKIIEGTLIILNQQCVECEYRNQWKSQVSSSITTTEDQHLTGGTKALNTAEKHRGGVFSKIPTFPDKERDLSEEEAAVEGAVNSDVEWNPTEDVQAQELKNESEEETEDESENEEDDYISPGGLKINELCTDCGSFYNILKPHTCEYKIKPYCCNICGKRCVRESSLKHHSRIHEETYEHPCKYCYIPFKTKADKFTHEQTHQGQTDPYICPDCSETFASLRKRNSHLKKHRGPKKFKCDTCGIDFNDVHHLRRHSVVHTGVKPYVCSVCHRGFNQGSHLKSHMRLHTGERPYKCQHCDKSFNHNVSLKSHVQRYHASSPGGPHKKRTTNDASSDTDDTQDNGKMGNNSGDADMDKEQEMEEGLQKQRSVLTQYYRRTGRPKGRPKRNAAGKLILTQEESKQSSNNKSAKLKRRKLKKTLYSDEESEEELTDSDIYFDSAKEEEDASNATRKSTGVEDDSDFGPEEEMKEIGVLNPKNNGTNLEECRGRPTKKVDVQKAA